MPRPKAYYDIQHRQMTDFISRQLNSSGKYSAIEPGYRFGDEALDAQSDKQIYLKTPSGTEMLLIISASYYNGKHLDAKVLRASEKNIFSGFVLYKENSDDSTYFRRNSAHGHNRYSTRHVGNTAGNAIIWLTGIEKKIKGIYKNSEGKEKIVYYQPATERLDEALRVFEAKKVELRYDGSDSFAQDHDALAMVRLDEEANLEDNFHFIAIKSDESKARSVGSRVFGKYLPVRFCFPVRIKDSADYASQSTQ